MAITTMTTNNPHVVMAADASAGVRRDNNHRHQQSVGRSNTGRQRSNHRHGGGNHHNTQGNQYRRNSSQHHRQQYAKLERRQGNASPLSRADSVGSSVSWETSSNASGGSGGGGGRSVTGNSKRGGGGNNSNKDGWRNSNQHHGRTTPPTLPPGSPDGDAAKFQHSYKKPVLPLRSQYVALDCEMVGGITGESMCARVVLTNWKAKTIYDSFINVPADEIADFRTYISGIQPSDLVDAPTLDEVRDQVRALLQDKILVGHGLENDLASLHINHPWWMIRDTAYYPPFMQVRSNNRTSGASNGTTGISTTDGGEGLDLTTVGGATSMTAYVSLLDIMEANNKTGETRMLVPRKLKDLCATKLQREIQLPGKPHSPAEDAIAALDLYKSHRPRWEACMTSQIHKVQKQQQQQRRQQQQQQQQQQQFTFFNQQQNFSSSTYDEQQLQHDHYQQQHTYPTSILLAHC